MKNPIRRLDGATDTGPSTVWRGKRGAAIAVAALLFGSVVPGPSLLAQAGEDRGVWWGAQVHAAGARLTCDLCDRSRDLGGGIEASVGAYASDRVRVGVEGGAWTHREDDVREDVYSAGIVAEIHPRRGSGLHLVGGLGWSGYRAGELSLDAPRLRLGAGWDLPVTGSWVVGNRILVDAASFASLDNDGESVAESVGLSVVRLALYVRHR